MKGSPRFAAAAIWVAFWVAIWAAICIGSPTAGWTQAPAGPLSARSELPEAPSAIYALGAGGGTVGQAAGSSAPAVIGTGSISGTVSDIGGGLVAGAKVTLEETGAPGAREADRVELSDAAGRFVFKGVAAGRFRVTIAAIGLETFVSEEIALKPGEVREMQQISLPIASAKADVEVVVTQAEIAQEQITLEEKQRVLGVLPNFYTSYIWNAAPLTAGQKFHLAVRSATDPVEFLGDSAQAGAQYYAGTFPGYGYGISGYGKRFAAAYGDGLFARMIGSAVLPSLLHQDPRYFYKGSGTKKSRVLYALTRVLITRGDDGRMEPNYSQIGGSFLGGAISNAYHPAADRGIGLTITNGLIDTAGHAADNLIREFVLRQLTPSVPDYAQGKQ
jgi:hypothetical protein